jgi:hypothetical protein
VSGDSAPQGRDAGLTGERDTLGRICAVLAGRCRCRMPSNTARSRFTVYLWTFRPNERAIRRQTGSRSVCL